jgi:hypothetical protein
MAARLGPAFFDRPADEVARDLLGKALVRCQDGRRIAYTVSETEAYLGPQDLACHAARGRTVRTVHECLSTRSRRRRSHSQLLLECFSRHEAGRGNHIGDLDPLLRTPRLFR